MIVYDPLTDTYIQAHHGNFPLLDLADPASWAAAPSPTAGLVGGPWSSSTAQIGAGEYFGPVPGLGNSMQRAPDGADLTLAATPNPAAPNICFAAGVRILTHRGEVAVERLRLGDLVRTRDAGDLPVRWIGARRIDEAELNAEPALLPVIIAPGALGSGRPRRPLRLSPQHRVLASGPAVELLFGASEMLVAAVHLCGLPGVSRGCADGGVTYVHIMLDGHHLVFAHGFPAETLHPGPLAREAIGVDAFAELCRLFPDLADPQVPVARPLVARRYAPALRAVLRQDRRSRFAAALHDPARARSHGPLTATDPG